MRRCQLVVCFILLFSLCAFGEERKPLLPQPQEIKYGSGQLILSGLSIVLGSTPSSEDRFAAEELSSALSEIVHSQIPVVTERSSGRAIRLTRTGSAEAVPQPGERGGPESPEGYSIRITADGAQVRAPSSRGLFYAVQTLRQLAEGEGSEAGLPVVEIRDWPSLAYRGTMVDMSHGPLPTEEEVERQLDLLSHFKANQYYLYSEASIELKGYPLLNPTGRFSQEEIHRIVAYGRQRHIDVVPNLELYAHLHDLFRVEKYADLADVPHGVEFDPRNPKVMALVTDWVNQIAQLFPSPFVHVGFDETFQIQMAVREQGGKSTPAQLFVNQLSNVARLFQQHGKQVMAWADIMVSYPDIVSELPPGLIAVPWHYDSKPDPQYRHWLEPLVARHVPLIIQPGVSSWAHITPDFNKTFANIDTFLAAGRKSGALGLINSVWADDGQILFRMSFPGMVYGAAAAWQSPPMDKGRFFLDYARIQYPPVIAPDIAASLESLAESESTLQKVLGEHTMFSLWHDPFFPAYFRPLATHLDDLRNARLAAENAETHLDQALAHGGDPATLNSLLIGSRLLDYAGEKFQTAPELVDLWKRLGPRRPAAEQWWNEWESQVLYQDHSHIVDLMDAITELRRLYRAEWLAEYTPYRLDSALGRWDAEYQYWRRLQERLQEFSDSTHEGDSLPPFQSLTGARAPNGR